MTTNQSTFTNVTMKLTVGDMNSVFILSSFTHGWNLTSPSS